MHAKFVPAEEFYGNLRRMFGLVRGPSGSLCCLFADFLKRGCLCDFYLDQRFWAQDIRLQVHS